MTEEQLQTELIRLQRLYMENPKRHRIAYAIWCVNAADVWPEGAEKLYRQALAIFTELEAAGADFTPAWIARIHLNLGKLLACRGRLEEAEYHLRLALDLYRQPMGHPRHRAVNRPMLREACLAFAEVLQALGNRTEAQLLRQEAMDIPAL